MAGRAVPTSSPTYSQVRDLSSRRREKRVRPTSPRIRRGDGGWRIKTFSLRGAKVEWSWKFLVGPGRRKKSSLLTVR